MPDKSPLLLLLTVIALVGVAAPSASASNGDELPGLVAVEKGPFEVVLDLKGTFDQPEATEIAARPKVYKGPLEVVEAARSGKVRAGQTLVKFKTDSFDEQLEKATLDYELAKTRFEKLSLETKHKEEAEAIKLKTAEMSHQKSLQTYETFRDVLMPIRLAEIELSLKSSKDRLKDEEEQFEQLQKMYKDDDLVEETEEIVLNRSRRSLEAQRKRAVFTARRYELQTEVEIPRELEGYEFGLRKATNSLALAKATSELSLAQSQGELRKAKMALDKQKADLEKLAADRGALTLTTESNGMAILGQLVKGKWTKLSSSPQGLSAGTKASANQVLYTLVHSGPRVVRASVPESSVLDVRPGQTATLEPAATPGSTLSARVTQVAPVSSNGSFDVWLEVEEPNAKLLPGNACGVKLMTHDLTDALTVPATAVKKDGDRSIVHVMAGGEVEPREVEVGRSSGGRVQILSGLSAGDLVQENVAAKKTGGKK